MVGNGTRSRPACHACRRPRTDQCQRANELMDLSDVRSKKIVVIERLRNGREAHPKPACTAYSPPPPETPMAVASYFSTIFLLNLPLLDQEVNMVSSHRCAMDCANCLPSDPVQYGKTFVTYHDISKGKLLDSIPPTTHVSISRNHLLHQACPAWFSSGLAELHALQCCAEVQECRSSIRCGQRQWDGLKYSGQISSLRLSWAVVKQSVSDKVRRQKEAEGGKAEGVE